MVIKNYLKKRDIINDKKISSTELKDWGDRYFQEGFLHDALDFYERAKSNEMIEAVLRKAFEKGDYFLVKKTSYILRKDITPSQWLELGKAAEKKGMYFFAIGAYKEADVSEELARLAFINNSGEFSSIVDTPDKDA